MKNIIATNSVKNYPFTTNDIDRAEFLYGPATPILQGKMTRDTPLSKPSVFMPVPLNILQFHSSIDLYTDFLYVNKLPFIHTK